ncbi:MAG TPA: hypothetical protein VN538_03985 [Clostridia bacterium]|nr:hypothetical protein [Clostridia bacterium]
MSDIIKTWPSFMPRERVLKVFTHCWGRFYFSVGNGRPKQEVERMWFTHQGEILGHFSIGEFFHYEREGQLPRLRSISNRESEWQFRPGIWIAICPGPFVALGEKLCYESFRGWRYFELEKYRGSLEALIRI